MSTYGKPALRAPLLFKTQDKVANDKRELGICANCRFAFRASPVQLVRNGWMGKLGQVACGRWNDLIRDPMSFTCNEWVPRHKGQPSIGDPKTKQGREFNVDVVKMAMRGAADARQAEIQHRNERLGAGKGGWGGVNVVRK